MDLRIDLADSSNSQNSLNDGTAIPGYAESVLGTWTSQWGLVTLELAEQEPDTGKIKIKGFWGSKERKKGIIHFGVFDEQTQILEFAYTEFHFSSVGGGYHDRETGNVDFSFTEQLTGKNGNARLALVPGSKRFTGVFCEAGYGSIGNWTMSRPEAQDVAPKTFGGITGTWQSDWGDVFLKHTAAGPDGLVPVTGAWNDGAENEIAITSGEYDRNRGVLCIDFFDRQKNIKGSCFLVRSQDGSALSGTWESAADSGVVTLVR